MSSEPSKVVRLQPRKERRTHGQSDKATVAPNRGRKPYLLRAFHEWISDSGQTPHIIVDASIDGVEVPREYVQGGKIILNVSRDATSNLILGNDVVRFRARFCDATLDVIVPMAAVLGIYAREYGAVGKIFDECDVAPIPGAKP